MKLLILGDSISFGWGVEKGYADLLLKRCQEFGEEIEICNYSFPGATILEGLNRLPEILKQIVELDYFICNFGTNDGLPSIYGGKLAVSLFEFKSRLLDLINLLPDSVQLIFLGTTASLAKDINQSLSLYNQEIMQVAVQKKGFFIDLFSFLLQRQDFLQGDGLHPNELGHQFLADKLYEVIHF